MMRVARKWAEHMIDYPEDGSLQQYLDDIEKGMKSLKTANKYACIRDNRAHLESEGCDLVPTGPNWALLSNMGAWPLPGAMGIQPNGAIKKLHNYVI